MAEKVKVNVTGYVDAGKGPLAKGIYEFNEADAKLIVESGAGEYVKEAEPEVAEAGKPEPKSKKKK